MSLNLLVALFLMQPRNWLVFWPTSTHQWLVLGLSSTDTSKSCSSGLFLSHSPPNQYVCLVIHLTISNTFMMCIGWRLISKHFQLFLCLFSLFIIQFNYQNPLQSCLWFILLHSARISVSQSHFCLVCAVQSAHLLSSVGKPHLSGDIRLDAPTETWQE